MIGSSSSTPRAPSTAHIRTRLPPDMTTQPRSAHRVASPRCGRWRATLEDAIPYPLQPAVFSRPRLASFMNQNRLSCFLSYSAGYETAMARVRDLLRVLDVDVEVFDGPDLRPIPAVVHSQIQSADFVVVLLGPDFDASEVTSEPARWPTEEAVYAAAQNKPIALITHPGTRLPGMLEAYQTAARFDFRNDAGYANSVHNVVKHLLNTMRRVRLPPGDHPYYYERVAFTFKVERRGYVTFSIYHQLVAREQWDTVAHCVDSGLDLTDDARIILQNEDDVELAQTMGSTAHNLSLDWSDQTPHSRNYVVRFDPPVMTGARIGYRRTVELTNYFPLTSQELAERSVKPGFPGVFRQGTKLYYGTSFDVNSEIDSLSVEFQFPAKVDVRSCHAVALHKRTNQLNQTESTRISSGDALELTRSEQSGETSIALSVARPLAGHTYVLLYEPGAERAS